MTTADPTRSPAGTEALWLYTHLPRGVTDDASADVLVERSEEMLDRYAPGWRDLVIDRWVQRPSDLFAANANLVERQRSTAGRPSCSSSCSSGR